MHVFLLLQVLYFSGLVIRPQSKNGEYHFRPEDLPHMINPLETKLGQLFIINLTVYRCCQINFHIFVGVILFYLGIIVFRVIYYKVKYQVCYPVHFENITLSFV